MTIKRKITPLACFPLALALLLNVATAGATTPEEALAFLNQQRAANSIPAFATLNPGFVSWCPNEDQPGFGEGESFRDWAGGGSWSSTESPWVTGPLHQQSLYNPLFTAVGYGEVNNEKCLGVGDEAPEPASPTFYTFTGGAGPSLVDYSETVAGEGPFAPQELVGIKEGTPTGPDIILYAEGFNSDPGGLPVIGTGANEVDATSWSLTEASGTPVPGVQFVDHNTSVNNSVAAGHEDLIVGGVGFMIPPVLNPGTTYDGSVAWEGTGVDATQTFSFTTKAPPVNTQKPTITGVARVGATLTCSPGSWSGSNPITYEYAWRKENATTSESAAATYTVTPGDEGLSIACQVTATNSAGSVSVNSNGVVVAVKSKTARARGRGTTDALSLSPRDFYPLKSGPAVTKLPRPHGLGTIVSYDAPLAGTVRFTVLHPVTGHRQADKCKAGMHRGKRCLVYASVGAFTYASKQGRSQFVFTGRVNGGTLQRGSYRLQVIQRSGSKDLNLRSSFEIK
jgi:hypothetical protein